jgi:signal transduction histidine kinase
MSRRVLTSGVATVAVLMSVLFVLVAANSTRWVGGTFPGFFVVANQVIPSVALPGWFATDAASLFQHQVIEVDGVAVTSSAQVYERARTRPARTAIRYTLRAWDGAVTINSVRSRIFSVTDYLLVFGSFLLCGAAFIGTGLLVFFLRPDRSASVGLLSASLGIGVFALTAADLYGPHWFFRVHVFAECLASAGLIHLALVFPTNRLHRWRRPALLAVYLPFAVLGVIYEIVLQSPSAYSTVHLLASLGQGIAGLSIIAAVTYDFFTTRSALVRRRIGVVGLGTLTGFWVPTLLMAASGLLGGSVAVNWAGLTGFLFPLSLGYALLKQNLFEIDVFLRRAVTYACVVVAVTVAYVTALFVIGLLVPTRELLVHSPATDAVLNLGLLFIIASTRQGVQGRVDRVFFRNNYDAEEALCELSEALAAAHTIEDVVAHARRIVTHTLNAASSAVFLHEGNGQLRSLAAGSRDAQALALPARIVARLAHGEVVARYEWDDGSGRPIPAFFVQLDAELLVPMRSGDSLLAIETLAAKKSGRAYTVHDVAFLRAQANQVALAIRKGMAFAQLAQSQASLISADRLATLGRLTAGIAHETNTPLGAVLNSLRILADLGHEYADSIDDPQVLPDDHRAIAGEIISTAEGATAWASRAAGFINRVKMHGRDPHANPAERFAVQAVVEETSALLAHRLRATSCRIDFDAVPKGMSLVGSPQRLGQVLVNLVSNAIDAYEEAGVAAGRIEVRVERLGKHVNLSVRDWAGGIPADVLPRIFDELFTTKEPGRGTGLGLWIARNLVEEAFGGTLTVTSSHGVGSCFTATMPVAEAADEGAALAAPPAPRPARWGPEAASATS